MAGRPHDPSPWNSDPKNWPAKIAEEDAHARTCCSPAATDSGSRDHPTIPRDDNPLVAFRQSTDAFVASVFDTLEEIHSLFVDGPQRGGGPAPGGPLTDNANRNPSSKPSVQDNGHSHHYNEPSDPSEPFSLIKSALQGMVQTFVLPPGTMAPSGSRKSIEDIFLRQIEHLYVLQSLPYYGDGSVPLAVSMRSGHVCDVFRSTGLGQTDDSRPYVPEWSSPLGRFIPSELVQSRSQAGMFWDGSADQLSVFTSNDYFGSSMASMVRSMAYNISRNTALLPASRPSIMPYILYSTYSPLVLDKWHDELPCKKPSVNMDGFYAAAFEDLMLASRGREMVSDEERRSRSYAMYGNDPNPWMTYRTLRASNFDPRESWRAWQAWMWIARLRSQELLEQPGSHFAGGQPADKPSVGEPQSELDMYERFLDTASPTPNSIDTRPLPGKHTTAWETQNKPSTISREGTVPGDEHGGSILSTMTVTESVTLPDGTVRTTRTLKNRFADGRETVSETVRTTHPDESYEGKQTFEGDEDRKWEVDANRREGKRSGWFWK